MARAVAPTGFSAYVSPSGECSAHRHPRSAPSRCATCPCATASPGTRAGDLPVRALAVLLVAAGWGLDRLARRRADASAGDEPSLTPPAGA
ncbi:MAG: hypothetical protein R2711_07240 [Acidimicrobiales bacterium]